MPIRLSKFIAAEEAISSIKDDSVIAISGFNIATTPEFLIAKLWEVYERTGHPKGLFILTDTLPAVPERGLDLIGRRVYESRDSDFLKGMLLTYLGWAPWLQKLTAENMVEVYTWSIGTASYWFREVASGRPGLLTRVGLGTFLDPRQDGCYLNDLARERRTCSSKVIEIGGREYLFYQAPKPDVALIRATTSDELGNLSMEKEGILGTVLGISQAAKSNGGMVIAQVERLARLGSIKPKEVHVPAPLVDHVVFSPPEYHWQTCSIHYDPRVSGELVPPRGSIPPLELGDRKVIARRVALELVRLAKEIGRPLFVNFGIGIPALVPAIIEEEELSELLLTSIEAGPFGGIALTEADFGVAIGPFAIIPMPDMFTNYEGGIIDASSLGFMQVDSEGNVNPSFTPGRVTGPGGFPVIVSGSPRLYFAGGFTAGKRKLRVEEGALKVEQDGEIVKFVSKVYKIAFNGRMAREEGKEVFYITERAVFKLSDRIVLEEVAPGIDLDKDVLSRMEFEPKVSTKLEEMDRRIFREGKMNLKEELSS
ncbi:MAG: acyl CoA:acetate/3-ketoacid CoA transferase [Candidatus Korarchaeum sp.]|nr:acyl CoA:acetate/3-ketoacid CoA transferase [Candidatus Korarchaeum sp.]MDW8035277.1 CoA-transferase [Candidatus Korarchaeum sp.]